jgi:hypothetical protein
LGGHEPGFIAKQGALCSFDYDKWFWRPRARFVVPPPPRRGMAVGDAHGHGPYPITRPGADPTPPCDPSTDAKSPSVFRSPYGRGCYLLPTSPIKAMPLA